jgi:hypothetical protein
MGVAYEMARVALQRTDQDKIADEVIAKKVIELAKTGETDANHICDQVVICFRGQRL